MTTFERIAPVLPVRRVDDALAHYVKLGFKANAYESAAEPPDGDGPIYGFLERGAVHIHLARVQTLDPKTNTSAAYIYVEDADDLHAQWCAAGVGGRLDNPVDTPYGLREFAHIDPDGNLLRVGSELSKD